MIAPAFLSVSITGASVVGTSVFNAGVPPAPAIFLSYIFILDININIDTMKNIAKVEDILIQMKNNPADVRFADLSKVCIFYFGQARQKDGSHHVYKTPELALKGIRKTIETVVIDMTHTGEEVPQPIACKRYSGKFMVRVPPEIHRNLAIQASESGVSLNRIAGVKLSR